MSVFRFGEIRAQVDRVGPAPEDRDLDLYLVKLADPGGAYWIESRVVVSRRPRSSGSDFELAANMVANMHRAASDPKRWYIEMRSIGKVSPEELKVTIDIAERLSPFLDQAVMDAGERFSLYSEYREGTPGPLELGIARVLQLPDVIRTPEDIAQFFAYLFLVDLTSFHPDDGFENYVDENGKQAFTKDEIQVRERLMAEARYISEKYELDIYEIGLWVGALTDKMPDPESEASAPGWLKALSNTWI